MEFNTEKFAEEALRSIQGNIANLNTLNMVTPGDTVQAGDIIAAVGDSDNDLAMLKVAGYPVAMGNGTQKVKEMAKYITASNDEEGVAQAISHILAMNREQ